MNNNCSQNYETQHCWYCSSILPYIFKHLTTCILKKKKNIACKRCPFTDWIKNLICRLNMKIWDKRMSCLLRLIFFYVVKSFSGFRLLNENFSVRSIHVVFTELMKGALALLKYLNKKTAYPLSKHQSIASIKTSINVPCRPTRV